MRIYTSERVKAARLVLVPASEQGRCRDLLRPWRINTSLFAPSFAALTSPLIIATRHQTIVVVVRKADRFRGRELRFLGGLGLGGVYSAA